MRDVLIELTACAAGAATTAGMTIALVRLARGETRGAPGIVHAISRSGKTVGGSMTTGIGLLAASGGLAGYAVARSLLALRST